MTREQELKIDFAYYMAIANSKIYSEEIRKDAQNQAIMIGMQLGLCPMQPEMQQNEAANIDDPNDLSGTGYIR